MTRFFTKLGPLLTDVGTEFKKEIAFHCVEVIDDGKIKEEFDTFNIGKKSEFYTAQALYFTKMRYGGDSNGSLDTTDNSSMDTPVKSSACLDLIKIDIEEE